MEKNKRKLKDERRIRGENLIRFRFPLSLSASEMGSFRKGVMPCQCNFSDRDWRLQGFGLNCWFRDPPKASQENILLDAVTLLPDTPTNENHNQPRGLNPIFCCLIKEAIGLWKDVRRRRGERGKIEGVEDTLELFNAIFGWLKRDERRRKWENPAMQKTAENFVNKTARLTVWIPAIFLLIDFQL